MQQEFRQPSVNFLGHLSMLAVNEGVLPESGMERDYLLPAHSRTLRSHTMPGTNSCQLVGFANPEQVSTCAARLGRSV